MLAGHIARNPDGRWTKSILEWILVGAKIPNIGRPIARWPIGRPVARWPKGRPVTRWPIGRPVDRWPIGRAVATWHIGRPVVRWPIDRSVVRWPIGRPIARWISNKLGKLIGRDWMDKAQDTFPRNGNFWI